MIKVIKEGKTDFRKTCDKCGCIFEYDLSDINDGKIECPCCKKSFYGYDEEHLATELIPSTRPIYYDNGSYDKLKLNTISSSPKCLTCAWYRQMELSDKTWVGDSPCTWCQSSPYRITCTQ